MYLNTVQCSVALNCSFCIFCEQYAQYLCGDTEQSLPAILQSGTSLKAAVLRVSAVRS